MLRNFVVTAVLASCLATTGWAQSPATPSAPTTADQAKPVAKKPAPKAKPAASKPTAGKPTVAESGPCRLGVISVIGERYSVQKFGLTVFENENNEVPINWGLDDLVFARVRAAAGADPTVRRISYPKGAFQAFYHPKSLFIRDPSERLPDIVRSITPNANCERYLVATTFMAKLSGTNLELNGIGAYNQGLGSLLRHSHLFANITITLIDGRTYEQVRRSFKNFGARLASGFKLTEDDSTKLDNALFPDPPAAAASSAVLRERARALVADRLDRWLVGYFEEE